MFSRHHWIAAFIGRVLRQGHATDPDWVYDTADELYLEMSDTRSGVRGRLCLRLARARRTGRGDIAPLGGQVAAERSRRLALASASALALLLTACASVAPQTSPVTPEAAAAPAERSAPPTRRSPFSEPPGAFFADVHKATSTRRSAYPDGPPPFARPLRSRRH